MKYNARYSASSVFYLYLTFILLFCVLYVGRLLSLLHMYASRPVRQGGLPFLKAKPHILLYCTGIQLWLFILPFCCFFMLLICVSIIYVCRNYYYFISNEITWTFFLT